MASDSITSMVLDEVRSMRLAYNTTSPFPVVVPSSSRSSTSFSSTSVSSASGPKIIREYSTRPSESNTSLNDADQSRKRALDQSDVEVDGKRRAIASSTSSTSVTATPVLRYSLSNVTYRVNLEALSRVFSQYGRLIKLTRFPSHGSIAGYVQFESTSTAQMAINKLQGRNIYHGCCRLHLSVTDIPDLTIRADLDDGDHGKNFASSSSTSLGPILKDYADPTANRSDRRPLDGGSNFNQRSQFGANNHYPPAGMERRRYFGDEGFLRGGGGGGRYNDGGWDGACPEARRDAGDTFAFMDCPPLGGPRAKTVLFITNLDESKVTAERLFMIFGVFCDVIKVKIFYREKSKAIIQAVDGYQADTARHFMDGVKLWGKSLSVTFASAKYQEININSNDDDTWAKDFTYTSFHAHRFRGNFGHKHIQNVTSPIPTLYVSNVPRGATEDQIKTFFEDSLKNADDEIGGENKDAEAEEENNPEAPTSTSSSSSSQVKRVQFFPSNQRMAFVEMKSVDAAFEAIIQVHDRYLRSFDKGKRLFVNFSKVHLDDFNDSGWKTYFQGERGN